ncbi:EAL and HDOD domain-containing protein [Sulfurospirillum cavolei]|uniref:EAL and HDOD domain-containing protein n=1 Tax=Sulfurospirillum cavolei TaxID=366522 RepID=UPI000764C3BE|nr:EAL domain-containing protein [Sulfurospirillum cavolei]
MSTYVGRQPIFNTEGACFGYELLYRSCDTQNLATFMDNAKATARVIVNIIHNIGLSPIIGQKFGFINVDETMIFSDAILLLPKEYFGFEILEHTQISLALYERIKHLRTLGYRLSLDDFDCSEAMFKAYEPLFPYIDFIKVDIQAIGLENLPQAVAKLAHYNIPLLAEKIETYEEHEACLHHGFTFYQGYFFEKPVILSGRKIEPNTLSAIQLMNCIHEDSDATFIASRFATCPDLVYNLLRHVNSGAYHFKNKISSIKQMVLLLGPKKLLSWLGLFLYMTPNHRPFGGELFNNAKFRAKVMEELTLLCNKKEYANQAFLTGSLSLIDAYLNVSMEEFLAHIHLDDEIKIALLRKEGFLGNLLQIAIEMNHANDAQKIADTINDTRCFTTDQLYEACTKALVFVEETEH